MQLYIIIKIDRRTAEHVAYYSMHVGCDGPTVVNRKSKYHECVSFNAFFNSASKRNWSKKFIYAARHSNEFTDYAINDIGSKLDLPITHVDSIWELYRMINYDYKKKRFRSLASFV